MNSYIEKYERVGFQMFPIDILWGVGLRANKHAVEFEIDIVFGMLIDNR